MNKKSNVIKLNCILIILILSISLIPINVFAESSNYTEGVTIKVFYPLQEGFAEIDTNGEYSGYTYEYLMRIAQLTGWWYEFIPVEETNENILKGLNDVSKGEIHLTGAMSYNDKLAETYEYSLPYGEAYFAVMANQNNSRLNPRTLFEYSDIKVALVKSAERQNNIFNSFCKEKGWTYEPVYAESNDECKKLVKEGLADVFIGKDVTKVSGFKAVTTYSPSPFYFATSKDNKELIKQLNHALTLINISDPEFSSNLHEKYFSIFTKDSLPLTADEKEYLESVPVIRVAMPGNRAPIQYYDEEIGEYSGIIVDILKLISERSGIKFEFYDAYDSDKLSKGLENKKIDVVAGVSYQYNASKISREDNLVLRSFPIFSSPILRIINMEKEAKHKEVLVSRGIKVLNNMPNKMFA